MTSNKKGSAFNKAIPIKTPISIFPVLLVNFIGTLGYGIILPFLIVLVLKFGGNELIYGIMGATYSFFQLIGAPILGKWSDRFGRKKILLLSQAGTLVAWIFFIIALLLPGVKITSVDSPLLGTFVLTLSLIVLFIARALDGITGGNISVAHAYLADITLEDQRKANFGKMAASANLGFIVGPALAGILASTALGELLPVILASIISLAAIFVIVFLMPESKPCVIAQPIEKTKIKKLLGHEHKECYRMKDAGKVGLKTILKLDHIPFILLLYFAIFLAFNFFYVAFPVHAVQALNWNLLKLGIFFSVLGIIMVFVQGPVLTKMSTKFSDPALITAGSIILSFSFFLFTSKNDMMIFASILFFSGGNGIMWPSFLSLLSKAAGSEYQGAVQGYASSTGSLASIIGLIVGGIVYGFLGASTFLIPGILLILIFLFSFKLIKIEKTSTNGN